MAIDMDIIAEIRPGLYLGSAEAASSMDLLNQLNIKKVVSLLMEPKPTFDTISYHLISIQDTPDANILHHLPKSVEFLDMALQMGENVLVHCAAGVSRSSTVVIAYLMQKENISVEVALELVKSKRSVVSPNDGFLRQLELFEKMKYTIDPLHPEYRIWLTEIMAREIRYTGTTTHSLPPFTPSANNTQQQQQQLLQQSLPQREKCMRCRKCRSLLFMASQIVPHEVGKGQQAFQYHKRSTGQLPTSNESDAAPSSSCNSFFIEPQPWIKDYIPSETLEDEPPKLEGKISCPNPKCNAALGKWSWKGIQCSCGSWVSPAFMVHAKQVDAAFVVVNKK